MICEQCTGALCTHLVTTIAPLECLVCCWCKTRQDMYAEIPVNGDWNGGGFVMRIGCTCEEALRSDWRTGGFQAYHQAIADWNGMQATMMDTE